jgi:predicted dehydrogenase
MESDRGKTVRIGVIGLGFMGATHIAAINSAAAAGFPCELVAVCDRKESRRRGELWDVGGNAVSDVSQRKVAFDANRVRGFEHADVLLADPEIDLISICTRTDTHIDLAKRALRAGKHVIVEKPVSLKAEEIRELEHVANASGNICMPAMCMRFWPAWAWLKARIDDGQFGRCISATFTRLASMPRWSSFFADHEKSGGAIFDLHIHDADFVRWCFRNPDLIHSVGNVTASGAVEHVTTVYRFAKPQAATHVVAEGGWNHHEGFAFRMRYVAIFENATADFDISRDPQLLLCRGGKSEPVTVDSLSGYDLEIRAVVNAITGRPHPPLPTLAEAEGVTRLLDAERRSVINGIGWTETLKSRNST